LQDKVAIITGAARGMGAATARLFVAEGAKVVLTDILQAEGEALAQSLGADAVFQLHDVREESQWQSVVTVARQRFGRIDVLINNAGVLAAAAIDDVNRADIERILAINVVGPMLGIKAVAPVMKAQRSGSIVNVSSVDGFRGCNGISAYTASKWAVRGYTRSIAYELGPWGIRVNAVHPGGVDTPMGNPMNLSDAQMKPSFSGVPLQRIGKPEEIARASLFLASDESSYVCAAELAVDGGWAAGYYQPLLPGMPPS
jgi:3alpha(or 20beta)-hydroxysteroid dehydrogenase